MLHQLLSKIDLSVALSKTIVSLPQSAAIHYSLQFQLQERLSELKFLNYAYPWPNPSCFYVFAGFEDLELNYIYVANAEDSKTVQQFFSHLVKSDPEFWRRGPVVCAVQDRVQKFMHDFFDDVIVSSCGCANKMVSQYSDTLAYYMTSESRERVKTMQIDAPDGLYWDKLKESDMDIVTNSWRFQNSGESAVRANGVKVSRLPSVCLRENGSDALAAFEMVDFSAWMNALQTMPAYRRRGLATLVELKLAQELISQDIVPFKFVTSDNAAAIGMSEKSEYWTKMPMVHWVRVKMNC